MKINKKGFTLVELLVVIAIIGILSTVAVVNLNAARDKAKIASVQASLTALMPGAVICQDNPGEILNGAATPVACDGTTVTQPIAGGSFCATPATTWPILPTGWYYMDTCDSDYVSGTWRLGACEGTGAGVCTGIEIDCTEGSGCVKTP